MSSVMPPMKPPMALVAHADSDGVRRIKFRLWQIAMAAVTVIITVWFCTFGVLSAIISLIVAKHVLVAILIAGLNLPGPKNEVR